MKTKIKKTGEIVDVISYGNNFVSYIDNKGIEHLCAPLNYYLDIEQIKNEKQIDWEQRRYEIAKGILRGLIINNSLMTSNISTSMVKKSIKYADEMIKQLKEKQDE
jgi:hypothetical protein